MKTSFLFILFLIFNALSLKAQPNSSYLKAERTLGIDFQGIGTSFHIAKELNYKSSISFGGEIGILPDFLLFTILAGENFTQKHTIWSKDRSQEKDNGNVIQLIFLHAFSRWQPTDVFELDFGIRLAQFIDSLPMEDTFGYPRFFGLYAKPLVGFEELKIGGRFDFGYLSASDSRQANEFVIMVSPLIRIKF